MLKNHYRKFNTILSQENDEELSKKFGITYKAAVNTLIKRYGYQIENFTIGHCEVSGFITDGKKYVYFSTSDFRFFPDEWNTNVLVRSANHNKDYSGGRNQYTPLDNLHNKVGLIMKGEL